MNVTVTLGDIVVAGTVAASIFTIYYAVKAQMETIKQLLHAFRMDLNAHAKMLRIHEADIRYHSRKIAGVEGKLFGRRIEDRMPSEHQDPPEYPHDAHDDRQGGERK